MHAGDITCSFCQHFLHCSDNWFFNLQNNHKELWAGIHVISKQIRQRVWMLEVLMIKDCRSHTDVYLGKKNVAFRCPCILFTPTLMIMTATNNCNRTVCATYKIYFIPTRQLALYASFMTSTSTKCFGNAITWCFNSQMHVKKNHVSLGRRSEWQTRTTQCINAKYTLLQ